MNRQTSSPNSTDFIHYRYKDTALRIFEQQSRHRKHAKPTNQNHAHFFPEASQSHLYEHSLKSLDSSIRSRNIINETAGHRTAVSQQQDSAKVESSGVSLLQLAVEPYRRIPTGNPTHVRIAGDDLSGIKERHFNSDCHSSLSETHAFGCSARNTFSLESSFPASPGTAATPSLLVATHNTFSSGDTADLSRDKDVGESVRASDVNCVGTSLSAAMSNSVDVVPSDSHRVSTEVGYRRVAMTRVDSRKTNSRVCTLQ